jgi:hypothetical protein
MATLFVSPDGNDADPGTVEAPFRTIRRGVDALQGPGDVLFLRGGSYAENVRLADKIGSSTDPISIRAYGRERVTIDGEEPRDTNGASARFRIGANDEWKLAIEEHPDAHPAEYVSVRSFAAGDDALAIRHGAFMDRDPYTRLITYSRLEDLRATNQTFGRLELGDPLLPLPGFPVVDKAGNPEEVHPDGGGPAISPFKRPWVYMGPGLFFDSETGGPIHIRLSHTVNDVVGIVDYDGGTDPRQLRLAISRHSPAPLVVEHCAFVRFDHLEVRFGGNRTIRVERSNDVLFDHVRILAGSEGVHVGEGARRVVFRHCEVLGGVPTWMFRSDIKDGYRYDNGGTIIENNLAAGTSGHLLSGHRTATDTVIHHCEFVDGHDLSLFGQSTRFHYNWVLNMHDDALIVDTEGTGDLDVSHNVVMRCLIALSFARTGPANIGGARLVHRNLIDLRGQTSGIRPRPRNT